MTTKYLITAKQLKWLREEKGNGISQIALADETGIPRGNIATWERPGQGVVKKKDAEKLCNYFGIKLSDILNDNIDNENQHFTSEPNVYYERLNGVHTAFKNDIGSGNWLQAIPSLHYADSSIDTFDYLTNAVENLKQVPNNLYRIPGNDSDYFVPVKAKNMMPRYNPSDTVAIKEVDKDMVMYGNAYYILFTDGQEHIYYIRKGSTDHTWSLESENKHFDSREIPVEKIAKIYIIRRTLSQDTQG